jgi:hypothetical protein
VVKDGLELVIQLSTNPDRGEIWPGACDTALNTNMVDFGDHFFLEKHKLGFLLQATLPSIFFKTFLEAIIL